MKSFFKDLFEYNKDMNDQVIKLVVSLNSGQESNILLLSHLLNAQHIWNKRIKGEKNEFQVWQAHSPENLENINIDVYLESIEIIENVLLDLEISYSNSKKEPFKNKISDVLFHCINHANYHRAQIAKELRSKGVDPVATDYIFYKRER